MSGRIQIINELQVVSEIPADRFAEIVKNIKKGAKDQSVHWSNAIALVNAAFKVARVEIPTPDITEPWKQYEKAIELAVSSLSKARGIDGTWRTSYQMDESIRFKVSIIHPNRTLKEYLIDENSIEEVIKLVEKTLGQEYTVQPNVSTSKLFEGTVWKDVVSTKTKIIINRTAKC